VPWYHAVAESRHDLQNPTSPEKIRLLGEALGLDASSCVLDMASGRAGPALILAREFGCHIVGVERAPEFVAAARERVAAAGLVDLIELVEQDAATFDAGREQWDAALCLGASFVWGNVRDAVEALLPSVRPGGHVAVGEPYWRALPLPEDVDHRGFVSFADHGRAVRGAGAGADRGARLVGRRLGALQVAAVAGRRGLARSKPRRRRDPRAARAPSAQARRREARPARLGDPRRPQVLSAR